MTVEISKKEMSIEDKAEFLIAVRNLKCGKKQKWSEGTDIVALNVVSDKKVLVRLMTEQKRSRFVNGEDVKDMSKTMKRMDCDSGFFIGKRFTSGAIDEMSSGNIKQVSDDYMPPITSENILLTINDSVSDLCRRKCGESLKKAECNGRFKDRPCHVRAISDNALFHYGSGWMDLLKNDLRQLLSMSKIVKP